MAEMTFWIALLIGFVLGGIVTAVGIVVILALCNTASEQDDCEAYLRGHYKMKVHCDDIDGFAERIAEGRE